MIPNTVAWASAGIMLSGCQSCQMLNEKTVARPSSHAVPPAAMAARGRGQPRSSSQATNGVMIATDEVTAATASSRKNSTPMADPPAILPNAMGRVTNTRPGPWSGSSPWANTSGKIARPASRATAVSAPTTITVALGIDTRWSR